MTLTVSDMFAGWGGSTGGLHSLQHRGRHVLRTVIAGNHNPIAVEAHAANYPDADHDLADLSQVDPRRWPTTDILWASPSCTRHSRAQGKKRRPQPSLFDRITPADVEAERSRATMWDVVRFAEHHRYRAIVVENVVEVRDWDLWPAWMQALSLLGYATQVIYLNSMFANRLGPAAPQSRDRLYVACWRKGDRAPDLHRWTRPVATCGECGLTGRAVQAWKRPDRQFGTYGRNGQYWWRCVSLDCRNAKVSPPVPPASDALDASLDPGALIGERVVPLSDRSRGKVAAGLQRHGEQPMVFDYNGPMRPVSEPLPTQTCVEGNALVTPGPTVDASRFRMLAVDEVRRGMAFADNYRMVGTRRQRFAGLGAAVTPPAARDLGAAVFEALTGETVEQSCGELVAT